MAPTKKGAVEIVGEKFEFFCEEVSVRIEKPRIRRMRHDDRITLRFKSVNSTKIIVSRLLWVSVNECTNVRKRTRKPIF